MSLWRWCQCGCQSTSGQLQGCWASSTTESESYCLWIQPTVNIATVKEWKSETKWSFFFGELFSLRFHLLAWALKCSCWWQAFKPRGADVSQSSARAWIQSQFSSPPDHHHLSRYHYNAMMMTTISIIIIIMIILTRRLAEGWMVPLQRAWRSLCQVLPPMPSSYSMHYFH